jgi:hypothetical protein
VTALTNVTQSGSVFTKSGGTNGAQDAGFYSPAGYTYPEITFIAPQTNKVFMVAGHRYQDYSGYPDQGIFVDSNGTAQAFQQNPFAGSSMGSYNAGSIFKIVFSSSNVKYYIDGDLRFTSPLYDDGTFYLNCALVSTGASVKMVGFTPSRQGPAGPTGPGGASTITINEVSGTSQTLSTSNWNQYFYLTNAGFNSLTLPASSVTSNGGRFWTLRNATNAYLSITLTNTLSLTSPLVIPPSNATTLAVSAVSSNTILLL